MKIYQEIFDSKLKEAVSFAKIGSELIKRRLKKQGVTLNDNQLATVRAKLENVELENTDINKLTIQIDDLQLSPNIDEPNLHIQLDNLDEELDEYINQLNKKIEEVIPDILEEVSVSLLKALKRNAPSMLSNRKKQDERFESSTNKTWGKALDLLEMFLIIALEAGEDFNKELRPVASQENDFVFEVLTRLHARACQVSSEILTLLRAGHADGAHARWRSLHEITVIGFFVKSNGNDVAERYLLHDVIESYKAAKEYQEHCATLGYEPLSEDELNNIISGFRHLTNRFGEAYKEEYGWAAVATNNRKPTFRDIEKAVDLDHFRPFYKLASHNVHANPKGVFFKLGLFPQTRDLLLAGPSNAGLADPGHGTAISLAQITTVLLTTRPNIDRLVICNILDKLEREIGDEFLQAHKSLEETEGAA